MNQKERRILHGLYYYREMVGERTHVEPEELRWLAQTPIPQTREWKTEGGRLQRIEPDKLDFEDAFDAAASIEVLRPIKYLYEAGLIGMQRTSTTFELWVTREGADVARLLDTWKGRVNLWMREHKDDLTGYLVTVAISAVVSLAVALFVTWVRGA